MSCQILYTYRVFTKETQKYRKDLILQNKKFPDLSKLMEKGLEKF